MGAAAVKAQNEFTLVLAGKRGRKEVFGEAGIENVPEGALFTGYVSQDDLPASMPAPVFSPIRRYMKGSDFLL